jgi:hypothetical protein
MEKGKKNPGENRREHQKGGKKEEKKGRKRATANNPIGYRMKLGE